MSSVRNALGGMQRGGPVFAPGARCPLAGLLRAVAETLLANGFELSNKHSRSPGRGEPGGEPPTPDTGLRQATASPIAAAKTPRQAIPGGLTRPLSCAF